MNTEELMIELDKKIESKQEAIKHDVSYLISALTDIQCSVNIISYLSYLKDDLKQKAD